MEKAIPRPASAFGDTGKKGYLNSDGQQFHHYQQNEQPPLTYNHWTHKKYHYNK